VKLFTGNFLSRNGFLQKVGSLVSIAESYDVVSRDSVVPYDTASTTGRAVVPSP
jgi:hypothetical protein